MLGPGDFRFVILQRCCQSSSSLLDVCQFATQPDQVERTTLLTYSFIVCCSCITITALHYLQVHFVNGLWIRRSDLEANSWEGFCCPISGDDVPVLDVWVRFQGELLPSWQRSLDNNNKVTMMIINKTHQCVWIKTPELKDCSTLSVSQSHRDSTVMGLLEVVRRSFRGAMVVLRFLRSANRCSQFCTAFSSAW